MSLRELCLFLFLAPTVRWMMTPATRSGMDAATTVASATAEAHALTTGQRESMVLFVGSETTRQSSLVRCSAKCG